MATKEKIEDLVKKLSKGKVYIIGDIILDQYIWSSVERISPEAPVPIAKVNNKNYILGGAANVANNVASLGGEAFLIGQVGNDIGGKNILLELKKSGIRNDFLIKNNTPTIIKTRILSNAHHLIRIDDEDIRKLPRKDENKIINLLKKIKPGSILIVSDYNKGTITKKISDVISQLAKKNQLKVLLDPAPNNFGKIKNSFLVKPNKKEAESIVNKKIDNKLSSIKNISEKIKDLTLSKNVLITLGADGMYLYSKELSFKLPVYVRKVFDVSGAGDTVIAVIGSLLSAGVDIKSSILLSALASGLIVEKVGTATFTQSELLNFIKIHENIYEV